MPPAIDLVQFGEVGLIEFSSTAKGKLGRYTTQKFLEVVSKSQMGARVLELGSEENVLGAVQHESLDLEAVKAAGEKYRVNALVIGELEVSDVKPRVSLSSILKGGSFSAVVEATITVKLVETGKGATVWTDSAQERKTVAHVSVFSGGEFFFDARDPEEAYGELINALVRRITRDFRAHYRRM